MAWKQVHADHSSLRRRTQLPERMREPPCIERLAVVASCTSVATTETAAALQQQHCSSSRK